LLLRLLLVLPCRLDIPCIKWVLLLLLHLLCRGLL
jgi:hypothetical protein